MLGNSNLGSKIGGKRAEEEPVGNDPALSLLNLNSEPLNKLLLPFIFCPSIGSVLILRVATTFLYSDGRNSGGGAINVAGERNRSVASCSNFFIEPLFRPCRHS